MTVSRKRSPTESDSDLYFGSTKLAEKKELESLSLTLQAYMHIFNITARAGQKLGAFEEM